MLRAMADGLSAGAIRMLRSNPSRIRSVGASSSPHLEFDERIFRAKLADRCLKPPCGEGIGERHPQPAGNGPGAGRFYSLGFGSFEFLHDLAVEREKLLSRVRQAQASSRPVQQPGADRIFQIAHHTRGAGRREAGLFRRPRERASPHHLQEQLYRRELVQPRTLPDIDPLCHILA